MQDYPLALPHIYSIDEPAEFRRLVKAALDSNLPPAGADNPELRNSMLWEQTLNPIPDEFAALVAQPDNIVNHSSASQYAVRLR